MLEKVRAAMQRLAPAWADASRPAPIEELHTRKALVSKSLIGRLEVADDAVLTTSGALVARAGGDIIVNAGGAALMASRADLHITSGVAVVMAAQRAQVESGTIGVLVAQHAELQPGVRVLLTTRQALVIGAFVGIAYPLVRYLLQRLAPPPEPPPQEETRLARLGRWLLGVLLRVLFIAAVGFFVVRQVRRWIAPVLRPFAKK